MPAGTDATGRMRITTLPGVFAPLDETWLLCDVLRRQTLPPGARVLDLCTGSGAVAIAAYARGAASVTAVDCSRRAVLTARLNARRNGARVRALRGDLFSRLDDETFDVILCNPPYVPAASDDLPRRGRARATDGGLDGRLVLDRVIAEAPRRLNRGGILLLVHSTLCGTDATLDALRDVGLRADVVERRREPFGPVLAARAAMLEARGILAEGHREDELVVVRGRCSPVARVAAPRRAPVATPA